MIKFFRHIRQRMIKENRVSRYLVHAIGKIVLVVVRILSALQLIGSFRNIFHRTLYLHPPCTSAGHITRYILPCAMLLLLACTAPKKSRLANLEKKIFALVPEETAPADDLPSERIVMDLKGRSLHASWVSAGDTAPAFFLLHGNGEHIGEWRPLQAFLLQHGYSSFVFDYTGFGSSTGSPTIAGLNADGLAAYKRFAALSSCATRRIAFGHSLGASILLDNAPRYRPLPDKVVVHGTFSTGREILVEKKVIEASEKDSYPDVWNGYTNVRRSRSPLYIVHSRTDRVIPFAMSAALAEAAGTHAAFLALDSAGHNDVYKLPTMATWRPILDLIE